MSMVDVTFNKTIEELPPPPTEAPPPSPASETPAVEEPVVARDPLLEALPMIFGAMAICYCCGVLTGSLIPPASIGA